MKLKSSKEFLVYISSRSIHIVDFELIFFFHVNWKCWGKKVWKTILFIKKIERLKTHQRLYVGMRVKKILYYWRNTFGLGFNVWLPWPSISLCGRGHILSQSWTILQYALRARKSLWNSKLIYWNIFWFDYYHFFFLLFKTLSLGASLLKWQGKDKWEWFFNTVW